MPDISPEMRRWMASYLDDPTLTPLQRDFIVRVAQEADRSRPADSDIDGELLLEQILASKGDPAAMPSLEDHAREVRKRRRSALLAKVYDTVRMIAGVAVLILIIQALVRLIWHAGK